MGEVGNLLRDGVLGNILIFIFIVSTSAFVYADDGQVDKLTPMYSKQYIESFTPREVMSRSLDAKPFHDPAGLNSQFSNMSLEVATALIEYIKTDDLYIYDLEKAEANLKAQFGESVAFEFRQNILYAYQALIAYDINHPTKMGLAFDVGLEYLKRVKYDTDRGAMDPILQTLLYRTLHTSQRSTFRRLIDTLSESHTSTTLRFLTNGVEYGTHKYYTHLEYLLHQYLQHAKFFEAPDKDALFRVVKRTIDYLYEENQREPRYEIRREIYLLADTAKFTFDEMGAKQAVRYLETVTTREEDYERKRLEELKVLKASFATSTTEANFKIIITEFLKSDKASVLSVPYGKTVVEIAVIRRVITDGSKVVQLGQITAEYLYTIKLKNPGESPEQAMRIGLELLLANPLGRGVYYEQELRVPSNVDGSLVETTNVGREGVILRAKAGAQCAPLFE